MKCKRAKDGNVYRLVPASDPRPHVPFVGAMRRRRKSEKYEAKRQRALARYAKQPCTHLGQLTGERRPCTGCGNKGKTVAIHKCEIFGVCTFDLGRKADKVIDCYHCHEYAGPAEKTKAAASVSINQGAGGLGDGLLGACAVNGFRKLNPDKPITYKAGPIALPFLELFDLGTVTIAKHDWDNGNAHPRGNPHPDDLQMNPGYAAELKSKGNVSRLERNCRNIGIPLSAAEIPDLKDRAGLVRQGEDFRNAIVLSPFSTWSAREWPLSHWITLERILREHGYRVVVLDAPDARYPDRHKPLRSEIILGAPADRVAGILLNAACFVGNDSGLAHLSAIMGQKTLALCGQTTGKEIYGFYGPQARWLEGHLDCRGCWWQKPFNKAICEPICPNLATITPDEVLATIRDMAGEPQPRAADEPGRWVQGETSKAHARRVREGWFAKHCRAPLLDIGCWVDYLLPGFSCRRWDQMYGDGDATLLDGVPAASYATVYASHVLEHLVDPLPALRRWREVLMPGGKMIVAVPHRDLYEGKKDLPSRWNADHKTFWLADDIIASEPHTKGLLRVLREAIPDGKIIDYRVIAEGHSYPDKMVHPKGEYSIEAIVQLP